MDAANGPQAMRSTDQQDRHARSLFDGIDDAVFVHDLDGHILEANPAACRRLGYTREEFLRLTTRDIDDPEFAAGFAERLKQQQSAGRLTCEGRHRTKDGRVIPVDINTSQIEIDGKTAVLAVIRDITRRKVNERRRSAEYAITRILAEATRVRDATPQILQALCEGVEWDAGAIWTVDHRIGLLRCASFWRAPNTPVPALEALSRHVQFGEGEELPGRVWQRNATESIEDLAAHVRVPKKGTGPLQEEVPSPSSERSPRHTAAVQHGLRATFAVPIALGDEVLGVIEFFSRQTRRPDDDLLRMLSNVVTHIGQFITRKRAERALRESEAFYHSLVESLPQNILRKDRDGRFTFANQRACAIFGKARDEIIGKTDFDLFPTALAAKYRRDDHHVLSSGRALEVVEENIGPSGERIYVQIIKSPLHDAQGNPVGVQVIFWDVTERKRAEEALADSEKRYRQLTEAAQDAIIVADQRGDVTLFNPAAEKIFGYRAEEVIGRPISMLMSPEYRSRHEHGLHGYVQTRSSRLVGKTIEVFGLNKNGVEFPIELALSAFEAGGEIRFMGSIRDLSERNRMRAVLVQNEKLASIGVMSAGVAHEINNPLAYVSNNLAVLQRDNQGLLQLVLEYQKAHAAVAQADPDAARRIDRLAEEIDLPYIRQNLERVLARTRDGVERVTRIVQSMRGLARTAPPQREEANLPDLAAMSLEMLRGQLQRRGIAVEQDWGPTHLRCVSTQISQVLLGLLINAEHAIEAAQRDGNGRIRLSSRQAGEELVIEVADNGCGIDPKNVPRLFDPFFTTKPVGEGTGLGLFVTHSIITAHGGRIEVESKLGEGSCFRIYLPQDSSEKGEADV